MSTDDTPVDMRIHLRALEVALQRQNARMEANPSLAQDAWMVQHRDDLQKIVTAMRNDLATPTDAAPSVPVDAPPTKEPWETLRDMNPAAARTLRVPCPECGAGAGMPCSDLHTSEPRMYPHWTRQMASWST